MKPTGDDIAPLAIPPDLLAEIQADAEKERRPAADVLRDALERGLDARRWEAHSGQEFQRARALGLPDTDQPTTSEYRQTLREKIAQGLASARAGEFVDGDAVFARIEAEMVALERKGRG
jgi:predicted transcriptional regulator